MQKKVLVIAFSNLLLDARVKRQVSFLKNSGFQITVACYSAPDELAFIKLNPPRVTLLNKFISGLCLLVKLYDQAYQLLYHQKIGSGASFDLIIANDIEALPLAVQLKSKAKIIFDAHEYAPRHFEDKLSWRIFFQGFNTYLCKKYIPKVDGMITIGEGIAREYEKNFGVKASIITNAPPYHALNPQPVNDRKIKLIHQGIANPSRKLELMFAMMELLDERFYLDLMLMEPTFKSGIDYLAHLKAMAKNNRRITFVAPQPTDKLIETLNRYDLGIVLIPPVNFNYQNTLPNKFFECIQARIALAIGPIPEMKKITEQYNIGVVSADFEPASLAKKISELSVEVINGFKINTTKAAQELNAGKNEQIFKDLISRVMVNQEID